MCRHDDQRHPFTGRHAGTLDRKSTRLNSSHMSISYAVFCLKKDLGEIRSLLAEIAAQARLPTIGEGKAFDAFSQLRARFDYFSTRAQTSMTSPPPTIDLLEA